MNVKIRIPTEQYAFIEIDTEVQSIEEAKEKYDEVKRMCTVGFGLADKEWRNALDRYLKEGTLTSEEYNTMDEKQQGIIQEIKKAYKRINK